MEVILLNLLWENICPSICPMSIPGGKSDQHTPHPFPGTLCPKKNFIFWILFHKNISLAHREPIGLVQLLVDHTDDEDQGDHAEYGHDGEQNFLPSRLKSPLCDKFHMVNSLNVHLETWLLV